MTSIRKGYLRLARQSLRVSRTRSFMTMLGIVIGVISVVLIAAIGEGVKQQIGDQTARYGRDVLIVRPAQPGSVLDGGGLHGGVSAMLSPDDSETVRQVTGVATKV